MKNNYNYSKLVLFIFAFVLMQIAPMKGYSTTTESSADIVDVQKQQQPKSNSFNPTFRAIIPTTTNSCTYEFYNGDINDPANLVQTQIVLNGEKLLIPETPKAADSVEPSGAFIGWFEGDDTEAFSFPNPITVTETKTVKLRARYSDKVYVHFIVKSINAEGDLKVATTKEVKKGEAVNVDDIPIIYPEGKKLTHWTLTPDADGNGPIYDFATGVTENISLYAVYNDAWRVYFRMRGGKSILPKYYDYGATLDTPEEIVPYRTGYVFKGWFLKEKPEDTLDDGLDSNFGNSDPVTKNLELYALWNKGTANYKVAHWQQNADDNGYSYKEIEEKSGTTESEATYTPKNYPGFILNEVKTNEDKPNIDGFGTTVKHVFYDRKMYTLSFEKEGEETKEFENVRYGAKTDEHWNQIAAANPEHVFSIYLKGENKTIYYTHPPRMLNEDFVIKLLPTKGERYTVYYRDREDGAQLLPPFSFNYTKKSDGDGLKLYPDGTSVVEGYTQETYVEGDSRLSFVQDAETLVFEATRYFTRNNNYKITFLKNNGDSKEEVVEGISFGEALVGKALPEFKKGETKRESDNFIFGGWFTAEETHPEAKEFVFENENMPAYDIILYAKWLKPTYKVYFHPNNDKTSLPYDSLMYDHNTVIPESDAQAKVSALTDPDRFFKWFWYPSLERYVRYDFGMPITEDVHLYPTWDHPGFTVTYVVPHERGTAPVDNNKYFVGKDAIVKDKTDDMVHPQGKVFVGWKLKPMSEDEPQIRDLNRLYIPGEKIVVDKDITLYDWWEDKPKMTEITYKANGGEGEDITVDLMNNETHVTKAKETFTLAGKEIKSWNTKPDDTGDSFEPGVSVIVNNNPETPNVLYAIWGDVTGIVNIINDPKINYHPNPVSTHLYIDSEYNISKVEVIDALGKRVKVVNSPSVKGFSIDFSNLSSGIYLVRFEREGGSSIFKVIKK